MPALLVFGTAGLHLRVISIRAVLRTANVQQRVLKIMSTVVTSARSSRLESAIVKEKTSLTSLARDLCRLRGDCSPLSRQQDHPGVIWLTGPFSGESRSKH